MITNSKHQHLPYHVSTGENNSSICRRQDERFTCEYAAEIGEAASEQWIVRDKSFYEIAEIAKRLIFREEPALSDIETNIAHKFIAFITNKAENARWSVIPLMVVAHIFRAPFVPDKCPATLGNGTRPFHQAAHDSPISGAHVRIFPQHVQPYFNKIRNEFIFTYVQIGKLKKLMNGMTPKELAANPKKREELLNLLSDLFENSTSINCLFSDTPKSKKICSLLYLIEKIKERFGVVLKDIKIEAQQVKNISTLSCSLQKVINTGALDHYSNQVSDLISELKNISWEDTTWAKNDNRATKGTTEELYRQSVHDVDAKLNTLDGHIESQIREWIFNAVNRASLTNAPLDQTIKGFLDSTCIAYDNTKVSLEEQIELATRLLNLLQALKDYECSGINSLENFMRDPSNAMLRKKALHEFVSYIANLIALIRLNNTLKKLPIPYPMSVQPEYWIDLYNQNDPNQLISNGPWPPSQERQPEKLPFVGFKTKLVVEDRAEIIKFLNALRVSFGVSAGISFKANIIETLAGYEDPDRIANHPHVIKELFNLENEDNLVISEIYKERLPLFVNLLRRHYQEATQLVHISSPTPMLKTLSHIVTPEIKVKRHEIVNFFSGISVILEYRRLPEQNFKWNCRPNDLQQLLKEIFSPLAGAEDNPFTMLLSCISESTIDNSVLEIFGPVGKIQEVQSAFDVTQDLPDLSEFWSVINEDELTDDLKYEALQRLFNDMISKLHLHENAALVTRFKFCQQRLTFLYKTSKFFNKDLFPWDTARAPNFDTMFIQAMNFITPEIPLCDDIFEWLFINKKNALSKSLSFFAHLTPVKLIREAFTSHSHQLFRHFERWKNAQALHEVSKKNNGELVLLKELQLLRNVVIPILQSKYDCSATDLMRTLNWHYQSGPLHIAGYGTPHTLTQLATQIITSKAISVIIENQLLNLVYPSSEPAPEPEHIAEIEGTKNDDGSYSFKMVASSPHNKENEVPLLEDSIPEPVCQNLMRQLSYTLSGSPKIVRIKTLAFRSNNISL